MKELMRIIEEAALEMQFSGVISIFGHDSMVFSKAFGYRDVRDKLKNRTNTRFGIASGTKFFTALGIGVLVEQGVISLSTAVKEIDREYTGFIDEHATILQLLTHTSGIYDYYDEEIEQDYENFSVEIPWYALKTPSDYYPLFKGKAMKFAPGERYSYSNGGYVFLGILIERLTGRLYREFVRDHVLRPANMKRSGFYALNDLPENTANGYLRDRRTTNIYQLPVGGGGDGGMYTTTDDLRAFWDSLSSWKILSKELTITYFKTHCVLDSSMGYGCGIFKRLDDSMFAIMGGDAGIGFDSWYSAKERLIINVLSNITNGAEEMTDVILRYL